MLKNTKHIKLNLSLFLAVVFLLISVVSKAQVNATAKIDSSEILVGDHVNLDIEVSYSKDLNLKWPLILDTLTKYIEVINQDKIDTSRNNQLTTLKNFFKFSMLLFFFLRMK